MHPFFKPNITTAGRVARFVFGCLLAAAAGFLWQTSIALSMALGFLAVFCWFEAARGWCLARACGIKTRL